MQRRFEISGAAVSAFCTEILRAQGEGGALTVVFVGVRRMRALNRKYRDRDAPTDVLSFAYENEQEDGLPFLGEIAVAPEVAWTQALRYRTRPEREIRKLLVHGILHLLGYDHEADRGEMKRLETRLLRRRILPDSTLAAERNAR